MDLDYHFWEYRNKERTWFVILDYDSFILKQNCPTLDEMVTQIVVK